MSQSEATRLWVKYTSLAIHYQAKADRYKSQVNRKTPVLFTERVARLAQRKANEMEQYCGR